MRSRVIAAFVVFAVASLSRVEAQEAQVTKLLADLNGTDMAARLKAADELGAHGVWAKSAVPALAKALGDGNATLRWHSARALGALGHASKEAVPQLTKALKDTDAKVKGSAIFALGKIGPAASAANADLGALLADPSADIRRAVVTSLHEINPRSKVLVPLLSKVLADDDSSVVVPALHYLAETGEACVPAMTEALANAKTRHWACLVLGEVGAPAKGAVAELTKALKDKDPEVRLQAAVALAEIGPSSLTAAKELIVVADDPEAGVRFGAIYALGKLGAKDASTVLEKHVKSESAFLKMISAWALAKIHPDNAEQQASALDLILKSIKDKDPGVRRGAVMALYELKAPPEKVAEVLHAALADGDPAVQANVAEAYASLGAKIAPRAGERLKDKELKGLALMILRRLGPDGAAAVPNLIDALKDEDPGFRKEVAFTLAGVGPAAAKAVPALVAVAESDADSRAAACYALGRIGPAAKDAAPMLRKNLASEDRMLKFASVWALLQILPEDASIKPTAVPILSAVLENAPHDMVRVQAAVALGDLGAAAKPALPMLKRLLDDSNPLVRQAAEEATKKIQP
jgi:HEAT repeat protein